MEFELAAHSGLLQYFLCSIELGVGLFVVWTLPAWTLVDGAVVVLFPFVHGAAAVRTPERPLSGVPYPMNRRQTIADLAAQL